MDMCKLLIDDYFTAHESKATYMISSSDPKSLLRKEVISDFSKYGDMKLSYELGRAH